jgi:hypothetical protein
MVNDRIIVEYHHIKLVICINRTRINTFSYNEGHGFYVLDFKTIEELQQKGNVKAKERI